MATNAGPKFALEVYDEFLTCKICLDAYKNPKCLTCLHTFCEKCIESRVQSEAAYKRFMDYRDFICPLCHKRTQLSLGGVQKLPDNFLLCRLLALVGQQRPSGSAHPAPSCDICRTTSGGKRPEATTKCVECVKHLCAECTLSHRDTKVTRGHSLFGIQVEKDIQCKDHPDEAVRFYCAQCNACVCVLCTFNEHLGHQIDQFSEAASKCRFDIGHLLVACKDRVDIFDHQVAAVNRCEVVIASAKQKIEDAAIRYIQEIRDDEQRLVEELRHVLGPEVVDQIERRHELVTIAENMRSACDIAELIVSGKDIELLLLKKDVEEKLRSVNAIRVDQPPPESLMNVDFFPGTVDFGHLRDRDKPLLSTMRMKRSVEDPHYDPVPLAHATRRDSEDQTPVADKSRPVRQTSELGVQTEVLLQDSIKSKERKAVVKIQRSTMTENERSFDGASATGCAALPAVSINNAPVSPAKDRLEPGEQLERRRRRRRDPDQVGDIAASGTSCNSHKP